MDSSQFPDEADESASLGQPSHTVYGGGHLFRAELAAKLSKTALSSLERYSSADLPWYAPVAERLRAGAVEDLRIDFEDGYGPRSDEEEDEHVRQAAHQLMLGQQQNSLPPRIGLRIKSLTRRWAERAQRTLELFARGAEGFSAPLRLTHPKTVSTFQVEQLCALAGTLEDRHGLTFQIELMVESPDALFQLRSWSVVSRRIRAVHFGPYDFLAACGASGGLHHPLCQAAKIEMIFALAGRGLEWADGPTTRLPIAIHRGSPTPRQEEENQIAVQKAWAIHQADLLRSRELGFRQSWILHPAQLVSLHAQLVQELAHGWKDLAARLKVFLQRSSQAVQTGGQFDDRATARVLRLQIQQALQAGMVSAPELETELGQPWDSLNL